MKKIDLENILPFLERELKAGNVVHLEYNFQKKEIKMLSSKLKKIEVKE